MSVYKRCVCVTLGFHFLQIVNYTATSLHLTLLSLVHRGQMAHPLHQDPEPSEAKRRRERLTQQAVQGKCLTYFHLSMTEADQRTLN